MELVLLHIKALRTDAVMRSALRSLLEQHDGEEAGFYFEGSQRSFKRFLG